MEEVKKVKVVGNKTTELVIGTAATKLLAATKSMQEAFMSVQGITSLIEEGTLQVVNLEAQIAELKVTLAQEKKNNAIDLELAFKAKESELVAKYLAANNVIAVQSKVFEDLTAEVVSANAKYEKELASEVAKAKAILTKDHQNEIAILNLQHTNKEASNLAAINQLNSQNAFLLAQVEAWKTALDAERAASVERSKANAIGTVNVGNK